MKILYKKHKKVADRKNRKPKTLRILTTAFDDGFPHSKLARFGYNPFLKRWHIHWRCHSQRFIPNFLGTLPDNFFKHHETNSSLLFFKYLNKKTRSSLN